MSVELHAADARHEKDEPSRRIHAMWCGIAAAKLTSPAPCPFLDTEPELQAWFHEGIQMERDCVAVLEHSHTARRRGDRQPRQSHAAHSEPKEKEEDLFAIR